jgi:hypothetical protein
MVWMELVRFRTTAAHLKDVDELLFEATKHVEGDKGLIRLRVYRSISLPTDIAVSLVWGTKPEVDSGSRAGLSICDSLKSLGLVDHSIWIEKTPPA